MRTLQSPWSTARPLTWPNRPVSADILVVAAGKPGLIGAGHVREGAVVVDVGINTVKGEKLEDRSRWTQLGWRRSISKLVKGMASAITPVPRESVQ